MYFSVKTINPLYLVNQCQSKLRLLQDKLNLIYLLKKKYYYLNFNVIKLLIKDDQNANFNSKNI